MEKIIEIDLLNKEDFFEKYNYTEVSKDLINYIIKKAFMNRKAKKIKIILNNNFKIDNMTNILKEGIQKEYNLSYKHLKYNNVIQLVFIILGVFSLFIASLLKNSAILNEIVVIGAWVLLWETIDLELFSDTEERRKRKILKKLLTCEIIEKGVIDDKNKI